MKPAISILALIVGVAIGYFAGVAMQNPGTDEIGDDTTANRENAVPVSEHDAVVGRLKRQLAATKEELAAARDQENAADGRHASLLAEVKDLRKIKELWEEAQEQDSEVKRQRMANIEKRFAKLSKMGIEALVANNEIGKLVADLLQEGERGREAVLALLKSEDDEERMLGIVLMLQGMASPESIDPLTEMALEGGDGTMRTMASQALLRMDDEEAQGALEKIVAQTKDEGVKVNSLYGLARQGNAKGVQQLLDYYNDPGSQHAEVLTQSLLMLRKPEAQPLIDAVVTRYKDRGEGTRNRIGQAAIGYYQHVNNQASRQALQRIADDPTASSQLRQMAQDALNGN